MRCVTNRNNCTRLTSGRRLVGIISRETQNKIFPDQLGFPNSTQLKRENIIELTCAFVKGIEAAHVPNEQKKLRLIARILLEERIYHFRN